MKIKGRSCGFTLIELLVVVSVIVVLSMIGLAVFSDSQKSARDAKRKQDITAISSALEARYNNGTYPVAVSNEWFVGNEPKDPKDTGTGEYRYYGSIQGVSYMYCAKMEAGSGGNYACPNWSATTPACTGTNVGKFTNGGYFCLTQRQ